MTTDLAVQALLAAAWRRKPKTKVMIRSDQGSPFTSREWQLFLGQHTLEASMSRRGNCHDNAVAELLSALEAGTDQAADIPDPRRDKTRTCSN